jgi:hypothetical protein
VVIHIVEHNVMMILLTSTLSHSNYALWAKIDSILLLAKNLSSAFHYAEERNKQAKNSLKEEN